MAGLDLSVLDSMGLPPIPEGSVETINKTKVEAVEPPSVDPEVPGMTDEDNGGAVGTVDSMEEFAGFSDDSDEPSDGVGDNSSDEESVVKILTSWAGEKGLLDLEEGEEIKDDEEYLIEKFNARVNREVETWKQSLPMELQELIESYQTGVPVEHLLQNHAKLAEFSSITPESLTDDVDLQKHLVSAFLQTQEYSPDEIKRKLERYEDADLLADEAEAARKKLIRQEEKYKIQLKQEAQAEADAQRKAYEDSIKDFKQSVDGMSEIFGSPLTKEEKEIIVNMTLKPVARDQYGRPINALKKMEMEDPNFIPKLAYIAGVLKWDLSKLEKRAKTKAVSNLKKTVDRTYQDSKLAKVDISLLKKAVDRNKFKL